MNLVIVESPAKAKTINKYLGKDFKVLASFGHVMDLPSKDGSVLPDEDFAMLYETSPQGAKHLKAIADAAKDCDTIYMATDPDREGEAISWHVVEALKKRRAIKKTTKIHRIVFHEITKKAVTEAIKSPREIDMDLVNAQQARRALDYLVGFTLSPVLWRKLPGSRSAGRVQSVALRMICDREEEIESFISREYWDIKLDMLTENAKPFSAKVTHLKGNKLEQFDITKEKEAHDIVEELKKRSYHIVSIEKKQSRRNPYPPFTTSSLQQEASRKLGFGAKKTMMVAQKLYEGVDIGGETFGLITYMRTDGVTVSDEALFATRSMIEKEHGKNYLPNAPRKYQTKAKNAQEAHEAIRPTDVTKKPSDIEKFLSDEQFKLYELIWKRMVASQMESAVLDQVAVQIDSNDKYASARANGSTIKFDGFYKIYREDKDDDKDDDESRILPPMEEGEKPKLKEVTPEQHFTQPPPRFTEASLVKRLEELGIGRPSTYASIISVLQDRNYVKLEKKRFFTESRGRIVTSFLVSFFERYVEYDFTAKLEEELDNVSAGMIDWKKLLRDFWGDFSVNTESVKQKTIQEVITELNKKLAYYLFPKGEDGEPDRKCPSCADGRLSLKLGKFGAFLGCSNYPECNNTKQLGDSEEEGENASVDDYSEPKFLGKDAISGLDITLRKGPYGFYVQMGEAKGKEKPKRAALPKGANPDDITLEKAMSMLALPREVGIHPETGKVIKAGVGRFGPYLHHDGKFTSLKDDDVLTVGINRAVTVIAEGNKGGKGKAAAAPIKVIGKHPKSDNEIAIFTGKYGPYVKCGKINASLPKGLEPDAVDMDKALELIAKQSAKKKGK